MDILIRGMKIPKNCDECRIMVFEDTNCAPELYCGCPIVFQAHPQGVDNRPNYCPLTPIPKHGRCIDVEPIIKFITDGLNSGEFGYDQIKVLAEIQYAPTIIPAEEDTDI